MKQAAASTTDHHHLGDSSMDAMVIYEDFPVSVARTTVCKPLMGILYKRAPVVRTSEICLHGGMGGTRKTCTNNMRQPHTAMQRGKRENDEK